MIFAQYIAVAALAAGILSKDNHRQAALCFSYAIVDFIWAVYFGKPSDFQAIGYSWWFVACGAGEAAIMIIAWICKAPASPYIAILSTLNLMMDMWVGVIYKFADKSSWIYALWEPSASIYHRFIPTIEVLQIVTLFLYSWPVMILARKLIRRFIKRKEGKSKWLKLQAM